MGWDGKRKKIRIYTLILLPILKTKLLDFGFYHGAFLTLASAPALYTVSVLNSVLDVH